MGQLIIGLLDQFKNVDSFSIQTPLCAAEEMQNSSALALFGNTAITTLHVT